MILSKKGRFYIGENGSNAVSTFCGEAAPAMAVWFIYEVKLNTKS